MTINFIISIFISFFLLSCSSNNKSNSNNSKASNINYLKQNNKEYFNINSNQPPYPLKDGFSKIKWNISAETEENAIKLKDHINFMTSKLKDNQNPKAWDKLFLMEAYMKSNDYYTTSVKRNNKEIIIIKETNDSCVYDVISAHADAVSKDFFKQGIINKDYSSVGEEILNRDSCENKKRDILSYISKYLKNR